MLRAVHLTGALTSARWAELGQDVQVTELTVTGGGGDPERTGYWFVTGPQSPRQVCAYVERTRVLPDDGEPYVDYHWYLAKRTEPDYRETQQTHMRTVAQGTAGTLDAAVEKITEEWPTQLNDA